VLELATKYRDPRVFERAMAWAWTLAQVQMRHLGIQADEANVYQRWPMRCSTATRRCVRRPRR
jgi:cyclic beta-1,2-glucan synthetase